MSHTYPRNRFVPGDYKRNCDRCGFTYLRSELTKDPNTGLLVCAKDKDSIDKSYNPQRGSRENVRKFD